MGRRHRDPELRNSRGPGKPARRQQDLQIPKAWKGKPVKYNISCIITIFLCYCLLNFSMYVIIAILLFILIILGQRNKFQVTFAIWL